MQQQTHNSTTESSLNQFTSLCQSESVNSVDVAKLVSDLFSSSSPDQRDSLLQQLAASVIKLVSNRPEQIKTQHVVVWVLIAMMQAIVSNQCKSGGLPTAALLGEERIRNLLIRMITDNNQSEGLHGQFREAIDKVLSHSFLEKISKPILYERSRVALKDLLGMIALQSSLFFYLSAFGEKSGSIEKQKLLKNVEACCKKCIKERAKQFTKQLLEIYVKICIDYQNLTPRTMNKGYQLIWVAITNIFQVPNLEKQLLSLDCLNDLLVLLRRNPSYRTSKPISGFDLSSFLKLILEPRNHEQILSRSIDFLCFWLEIVDQVEQIKAILNQWFYDLILKSDIRTSNIFAQTWHRVIEHVGNIGVLQARTMQSTAFQYFDQLCKSTKRQSEEEEMRIMKILAPLINKQFKFFSDHQESTLEFLKQIWDNRNPRSRNLRELVNQSIRSSIASSISPLFNLFVLEQAHAQLEQIMENNNIHKSDRNVSAVEERVSEIYVMITCFLFSITGLDHQMLTPCGDRGEQSIQKARLDSRRKGLSILSPKYLSHLILCHNSGDRAQLRSLLDLITMITKQANNEQYEASLLRQVRCKVDSSDEHFLLWMRDRLGSFKNQELRNKNMKEIFEQPSLYSDISLPGLQALLQLLLLFDNPSEQKHVFAFSLLRQIHPRLLAHSVKVILCTMWSAMEIVQQKWLMELSQLVTQMKFPDYIEITIYAQIIKISQQLSTCLDVTDGDRVLSEHDALTHIVNVTLRITGHQDRQKSIKCNDSLPFWKFNILFIRPMLSSATTNDSSSLQQISSIEYNRKQISSVQRHLSLRQLSEQYPSEPMADNIHIEVKLMSKSYVIISNLKPGILYHVLHRFYGRNSLTQSVTKICARSQLKVLAKFLTKIAEESKYNVEEILREELFYLIEKGINKIKEAEPGNRTQRLVSQLAQFLQEIDIENEFQFKTEERKCYHRKLISNQEYFLTKSLTLLQSPISAKTDGQQLAEVGYRFLSMLVDTRALENLIISTIGTWISFNPLERPYLICFGLEVLWLVLKDQAMLAMFIESGKFNQIFEMVNTCVKILPGQKGMPDKQLQIYAKIIVTGLKIFNNMVRLIIMTKHENGKSLLFITRQPQDLLSIAETQKNYLSIVNPENHSQFMNEDPQAKEMFAFVQNHTKVPQISLANPFVMNTIFEIMNAVEPNSRNQKGNFFMLLYEASRLCCWMIYLASSEHKESIINQLVGKLGSRSKDLPKICKSMLYLFLKINCPKYSKEILDLLFRKFHPKYSVVHDLLSVCFIHCQDLSLTLKITQAFFSFLTQLEPEDPNQRNEELFSILSIIAKTFFILNENSCEAFIQIVTENYLFCSNGSVKAIHPKSRQALYQSLGACLNAHSFNQASNLYQNLVKQIRKANSVQEAIKSNKLGVGLQNLGNICYMNSLLQLLHSIKPFVSATCSIQSEFPLLIGLQHLFINLTSSMKRAISPEEFVLSFDPPINVGLQEDTTQFFISFLDKLEEGDKSGRFKDLARSQFRGETLSKFVCSQCKKGKQILEDFYLYNLAIQNETKQFSDLDECLQNAKVPEIIYDVNCAHCHKQTKFTKVTSLQSIPDYFFIHLRRLIFDYKNPYVKAKVHSRLRFPDEIEINREKLLLKGVITHSGTGEHGHYYTTINQGEWVVYNDSRVYPLPENGKEDIWYGRNQGMDYSTNAYVLLYEKVQKRNTRKQIPFTEEIKAALKQVKQANSSLMAKELFFGQNYRADFINFAFNMAKLSNNGETFNRIYEILALVSYIHGEVTTTPPQEYFSAIKSQPIHNIENLIEIIFEHKEHNNRFLFHKNAQLREFFLNYLQIVFERCQPQIREGSCKLALVYACEIVAKCVGLIKDPQNFIHCSSYLKLVGFLIRAFNQMQQFLGQLYESRFIPEILNFFDSRKAQIQMSYVSTQVELMEPLIEVLLSFLKIIEFSQQSKTILFVSEYQQNFMIIQQFIANSNGFSQLIFMANSNFQYSQLLINLLRLNQDFSFAERLINIATMYIKDYRLIDAKTSKDFCFLLWFIETQFYSHSQSKTQYCHSLLGMVFPLCSYFPALNCPPSSLRQRTYHYLTSQLEPGFMETLSQLLLQCYLEPTVKATNLIILNNFLKLMHQINTSHPAYIDYFSNLCSPIGIFWDYYAFLMACLEDLMKKVELGLIITAQGMNLQSEKAELRSIIEMYRRVFAEMRLQNDSMFCGSLTKKPEPIFQKVLDLAFVLVQQLQNFWVGYGNNGKSVLLQFLDEDYTLKSQHSQKEQLTKVLKAVQSQTIEEQDLVVTRRTTSQSQRIEQESIPVAVRDSFRRRIVFTNINEDDTQFNIMIQGQNMKNKSIWLRLILKGSETRDVFVEKIKLGSPWGNMKIVLNGIETELKRGEESGSMDMEGIRASLEGDQLMM